MEEKLNHLNEIFGNAKKIISNALSVSNDSDVTNECFVLLKDLAHCGGKTPAPISIMRAGTVFRKRKDDDYFSDGFHLIARHVAEWSSEYFIHLNEREGLEFMSLKV